MGELGEKAQKEGGSSGVGTEAFGPTTLIINGGLYEIIAWQEMQGGVEWDKREVVDPPYENGPSESDDPYREKKWRGPKDGGIVNSVKGLQELRAHRRKKVRDLSKLGSETLFFG